MKLKLITLLGMAYFVFSTAVLAWDNPYDNSTDSNGGNSESGYESITGTRYQYDLSDPGDQVEYGVDVDAQMRDSISVDPVRSIDRGMGQYGGGIYGN